MATEKKILLIGDNVRDNLLIHERKSDPESDGTYLLRGWLNEDQLIYKKSESGIGLLKSLFNQLRFVDEKDLMVHRGKLGFQWETFSKWDIKEIETSKKAAHGNKSKVLKKYGGYLTTQFGRKLEDRQKNHLLEEEKIKDIEFKVVSVYNMTKENVYITDDVFKSLCGEDTIFLVRTRFFKKRGPSQFLEKIKEPTKDISSKTVLLLSAAELRYNGFNIQKGISWEQLLLDTAKCIKEIPNYRDFKAIVVGFAHLGALLYIDGVFKLFYYDDEEEISYTGEGGGKIYGTSTVMQAAITKALVEEQSHRSDSLVDALDKGIISGLYAMKNLHSEGYKVKVKEKNGEVAVRKIEFPYKRVAKKIMKATDDVQKTKKKLRKYSKKPRKTNFKSPSKLATSIVVEEDMLLSNEKNGRRLPPDRFESILKQVLFHPLDDRYPKARISNPTDSNIKSIKLCKDDQIFKFCKDIVEKGKISEDIVKTKIGEVSCRVPFLRFNDLLTYDKNEIEQLRDTFNVLKNYSNDITRHKPISICVFGPAGSGKSFAVKQIAKSLGSDSQKSEEQKILEFNLSQITSYRELVTAFHQVRDIGLNGHLPVVFFDEFDTAYEGVPLGWLRFFLAPMQDGEFLEEGRAHFLGRAIFVFAGSTYNSMKEFVRGKSKEGGPSSRDVQIASSSTEQQSMKLSDFISRIRGYIDISGPNPTKGGILHFFRRATLLRSVLELELNISREDQITITNNVLEAFLNAKEYYHGSRSLEAIIQMSDLLSTEPITAPRIYKSNRLDLHVSRDFQKYLNK